ncbi:DUF4912 domain-containing protein [Bacillus sp. T3]|uniref:DUF4912 domain-containing protein n=1 Tax=Bacillus sp. T3 TaxID=467262 RepID=UPI00298271BE|nr:DUF4912 domain-containing protein [Bacillus sp. T3]
MSGSTLNGSFVSPDKIYASWDVSQQRKQFVQCYFEKPYSDFRKALRLYDVTHLLFNGNNAHDMFEFLIPDTLDHWRIKGIQKKRIYCLEFGILLTDTEFFPLLRSKNIYHSDHVEVISNMNENMASTKQSNPKWSEYVSTYSYYQTSAYKGDGK